MIQEGAEMPINARGPGKTKTIFSLKVRKLGNSLYVRMPKPFCQANEVGKGDPVAAAVSKNVMTLVFPGRGEE